MNGGQYFPDGFDGHYQQAPGFNAAGYGRGYGGMSGSYFMSGGYAGTTQQLGGSAPEMHMPFASQPAEDPALFVTFEEEDEDFPSNNRAAVARVQQMPSRRQPSQQPAGTHTANSRQQPGAGAVSKPQVRATSAGPVKTLSAAEQELEDLKRRIADKERQMKAKRQTGQGYSGMPARSRPNPAHGPVLRGLHRKQPPSDSAAQSTQEADLFLKQVAAELPGNRGKGPVQQPAGTSHGVTNPVSKEALLNQKSQPEAQASKKAVSTAAVKPTTAAQATADMPRLAKQLTTPETVQTQTLRISPQSAVITSKSKASEAGTASQPHTHADKPQPAAKQSAVAPASHPVPQSQTTQAKLTAQASRSAPESAAPAKAAAAGQQSKAVVQQPPTVSSAQEPAAQPGKSNKAPPAAETLKAGAAVIKQTQDKSLHDAVKGASDTHTRASQAQAARVSAVDDWSDKGVPVQSGYHLSDSPLPEEEEAPPQATATEAAQEAVQEAPLRAPYRVSMQALQGSMASRPVQPQAPKAVPATQGSTPPSQHPRARTDITASHAASPVKPAAKLAAKSLVVAVTKSRPFFPSTTDKASASPKQKTPVKQPAAVPAPATKAAAATTLVQADAAGSVREASANQASAAATKPMQQAQPTAKPSRLSISSSAGPLKPAAASAQTLGQVRAERQAAVTSDSGRAGVTAQPAVLPHSHEPKAATPDTRTLGANTGTTEIRLLAGQVAVQPSGHSKGPADMSTLPVVGKSSKAAVAKPAQGPSSSSPESRSIQHSAMNGVPDTAAAAADVPHAAPQVQSKADGTASVLKAKPAAPRQSSAALSGRVFTPKAADPSRKAPSVIAGILEQSAPAARRELQPAAVTHSTGTSSAAVPVRLSQQPSQPPLPESAQQLQRQLASSSGLQTNLPMPRIPGLASPQGPAVVQPTLPTALSRPAAASPVRMPMRVEAAAPAPPPLPTPTSTLSHPSPDPSSPLPPEPASPRPSPAVSPRQQPFAAAASLPGGSLLAADSGEDMEIDEAPVKEPLPPLPTDPFPPGLELAMVNSNQGVVGISPEERDSLLDELSGINARTDELRIQKRFLNDMFARVKQEYLERRLRQQQIEQMLGHKSALALPSIAAEEAGISNALALRASSDSPCPEQPEASPGDHRQARKAELQSRAELRKARVDALNAKQRSTPSAAKTAVVQLGVSPMTQKAIVDLTASPTAPVKQSNAPEATAHVTPAASLLAAAVTKPSTAIHPAADAAAVPKPPTLADKPEAVKPLAARPASSAVVKDSKQQTQPAARQSAASQRVDRQASSKDPSKDPSGRSPISSRQAAKRRRSRSRSPAQDHAVSSRGPRAQAGGQRQAATSSQRRASRSRSQSPPSKRGRHQPPTARDRQRSSSTSSSSASPVRRRFSSSSLSPVRRTHRQSLRSPSRPRQRGRRTPSPRARHRRAHSPKPRGWSHRSPSPSARHQRGSSPNRTRPQARAGGAARSPVGRHRQREAAAAGGSTTSSSTSRSPSPVKRKGPTGNPHPSRNHQRPQDPPNRAVSRRSSPSPKTNQGRSIPARSTQDRTVQPGKPVARTDGAATSQAGSVAAVADTGGGELPPPPDRPSAAQGPALPPAPPLPPPPPVDMQRAQAASTKPTQAPKFDAQVVTIPDDQRTAAKQRFPNGDSEPAVSAGATAKGEGSLLHVVEDREPQQRHPAEAASAPAAAAAIPGAASAAALPSDNAVKPAAVVDLTAAEAKPSKPSHSFDGKESFISLDLEDGPVAGPPSVDKPPSAGARSAAQPTGAKPAVASLGASQHAEAKDVDAPEPSSGQGDVLSQLNAQPNAQPTAASATAAAAAGVVAGKRDIRPDLSASTGKERPSSAASQGFAAAQFSKADNGQKLLAAPKGKAAAKGNIQIVLTTKHKQETAKGGYPFPAMFHALSAQGLPSQSLISEKQLVPLPLPRSAAVTDTSSHKYESPLRAFRSYRLCDSYQTVSQLPLASPSFTHRLDPHWPLCTYDIRGSCRDAKCQYQHASDYQLENVAVLRDLHQQAVRAGSRAALPTLPGGEITPIMMTALTQQAIRAVPSPQIILPSASGATPALSPAKPRPQLRIPRERRRQLASEDPLPLYLPVPSGPLSSQVHPFSSQLLSSSQVEREGVSWLLLPGWEGYDGIIQYGTAPNTGSIVDHAQRSTGVALPKPGDKMAGRYYQVADHGASAAAAVVASASAPAAALAIEGNHVEDAISNQRAAVLNQYEKQVQAEPDNQELWVLYALEHIDFGAVESMQGQKLMACLRCISKGLEADSSFTCLWLLYLPLYRRHTRTKGDSTDATNVAETCLSHSKHCYQLWLRVIQLQPDWQRRATLLQRGILAMSQAEPGDYKGVGKNEEADWAAMRSACVLDLVLRLLLLWTSMEAYDVLTGWITELLKLVGRARACVRSEEDPLEVEEHALGGAARLAVLQQLQDQPVDAAVLWISCAHLAAYNVLPAQVIHRLGFVQQPVVLDWQQAPPASVHLKVRSILTTAASACLGCLDLRAKLQVKNNASIQAAVTAAHPRQALALTIAYWELSTKSVSLLGTLPATLDEKPITEPASSLLMLASLTSKAACAVEQPLPDQAMDAWQHATWPTGDTNLLCMGLVLAAEQQLQSFADSFGSQAPVRSDQTSSRLQLAVSSAARLISQLSGCVSEALGPAAEALHEGEEGEDGARHSAGSQQLHPAVVGAMATRAFQISDGNPQAAMALLVASVLPEWELDLLGAGQVGNSPAHTRPAPAGPSDMDNGELSDGGGDKMPSAQGKRARSYRKRARSPSRSPSPGRATLHSNKARKTKRRRSKSISSSSTSGSSSSYSSSQSGSSSSSGSSSTSSTSSNSSDSASSSSSGASHDNSIRSRAVQQQYADAISDGMQSDQGLQESPAMDWAAIEAGGTLGGLPFVRQAFQELCKPAEPVRGSPDFEEGEIRAVDLDMKRNHAAHWSLNLSLYEALSGQAPQALVAVQVALKTAEGSLHLQHNMWRELLEFASATLPVFTEPAMPSGSSSTDASTQALLEVQYPLALRQKLQLLQQFQAWQQGQAVLQPLALPQLPIKDKRAKALLEQPAFHDGEAMKDAALALLAHVRPNDEVTLIEALVSAVPATAAKAHLLLDLAARQPQDPQYASWVLPLAATALLNAAPPAAPHLWLQAVVLTERHSVAAAKELSTVAVARHPHSKALAKRHSALQGSPTGPAGLSANGGGKATTAL